MSEILDNMLDNFIKIDIANQSHVSDSEASSDLNVQGSSPPSSLCYAKAYKEGLGADFTHLCEKETKKGSSAILLARSPFLEAKINRWTE